MAKTFIQEELFKFMIPHFEGKEYDEQKQMIKEMQEYLRGIKDALVAKNTFVKCDVCKNKASANLWKTREEEVRFTILLNKDYNEDDESAQIRANRINGICPHFNKEKVIKEVVLETKPYKKRYLC